MTRREEREWELFDARTAPVDPRIFGARDAKAEKIKNLEREIKEQQKQ